MKNTKFQLALDLTDLNSAVEIAKELQTWWDILEIGTALLLKEGLRSVEVIRNSFPEAVQKYLQYCKENQCSARYIGSLVADFHRNLLKGGIYIYPSTASNPAGKLRLMYECHALSFVVEQAGGMATTGKERIMEIKPESLHQRCPLFIGSESMVKKAGSFF